MSSSEVHDLIVRTRPEGIQETTNQLRQQDEVFEGTAESMDDTATGMTDVANRLKGVAGVVTAGLGIAAVGLLSQVNVVGEAASGLGAILDTLLLKIDEDVRPGVNNLTDDFFDLAEEIGDADSAAEAIGLTLGGLAEILVDNILQETEGLTVVQTVDFVIEVGDVAVDRSGLIDAIREDPGGVALAISNLLRTPQGLVADVGLRLGSLFAKRIASGIREGIPGVLEQVEDMIERKTAKLGAMLIVAGTFANAFIATMQKLWARIRTGFEATYDLLIAGSKTFANTVISVVTDLVNGVIDRVNSAIDAIEGLINSAARASEDVPFLNIDPVDLSRIARVSQRRPFDPRSPGEILGAAGGRLRERDRRIDRREREANRDIAREVAKLVAALQQNVIEINTSLDSKTVARQTEPFLGEKTGDQGRSNPL